MVPMALNFHRLRRALSVSSSLLHLSRHQPKPISISPLITTAAVSKATRSFTSTATLFLADRRKPFDPETDEIGPDTILFEGCDYNHWLITVDFPKDSNLSREQKIEFYVNIAAQVFGSVEEAKNKIYALSTTTYEGFQVECSEETSNKFQSIPGVVFVLPDSYIDPVNKEYGGDKYVNGEIFPRPPPVHYGRRNNRDRRSRDQMPYQQGNAAYQGSLNSEARNYGQNYGPPPQQNYGPPPRQNYGPPPQQNYGPPPQQNYGPPSQRNYGPPPPQSYGPPPPQNYGPRHENYTPPRQNFGPSPQQNYGPPQQENYGRPPQQSYFSPPPQQGYGAAPQQGYVPPQQQNSYAQPPNFPPQHNYNNSESVERNSHIPVSNASGSTDRNPLPSYPGNSNEGGLGNYNTQGQRNFQQGKVESHVPPEHRGFSRDTNSEPVQHINFGQERSEDPATRTAFGNNQPQQGEDRRFPQMDQRNFSSLRNN